MRTIEWFDVGLGTGAPVYLAPGRPIDLTQGRESQLTGASGAVRWAAVALNRFLFRHRIQQELDGSLYQEAEQQLKGHNSGGVLAVILYNTHQTEAGTTLVYVAGFVHSGVYALPKHAVSTYRHRPRIEPAYNGKLFYWGTWGEST